MFALPIVPGERADCRLWREEGGERVAAVDRIEDQRKPEDSIGHRNRKQVDRPPFTSIVHNKNNLTTEVVRFIICSHYLSSRAVARQVLSAYVCLTSVFGMGTGGPTRQSIRTY